MDQIPVVPLHDALYGRVQDMPQIKEAFYEAFDRLGLGLKIKADMPAENANFRLN